MADRSRPWSVLKKKPDASGSHDGDEKRASSSWGDTCTTSRSAASAGTSTRYTSLSPLRSVRRVTASHRPSGEKPAGWHQPPMSKTRLGAGESPLDGTTYTSKSVPLRALDA